MRPTTRPVSLLSMLCAILLCTADLRAQTTPTTAVPPAQASAAAAASAPAPTTTTEPKAPEGDHPRIGKVTFEGVNGIPLKAVRDSITTQGTRCRGLILKPLCAISKSPYFVTKQNLDRAELPKDELRIRVIYFRAGYRQAQAHSEVIAVEPGKVNVVFHIDEGPATKIGAVNVKQTENILTTRQIRQGLIPGKGALLSLPQIDSAKFRLRGTLWDRGYGDAIVADTISIDAATHLATLDVTIDPLHRTTIDSINIVGNKGVSTRTIERLLGLHVGDLYRRTDMTAAQRRLYETELFRQTLIVVPETPDSAKDITVNVREAPFTASRVGVGFNTTEFGQSELKLTRYNLWGGARRLDVRAAVGNLGARQLYGKRLFGSAAPFGIAKDIDRKFLNPTWEIGSTLTEPFVLDARASLSLDASTHRRIVPGIVIDRGYSAASTLTWRFLNHVTGSAAYQFEMNRIEAGDLYFCVNFGVCGLNTIDALRGRHKLSPVSITGLAELADDPLEPARGYNARVDLEHASTFTASDFRYNRAEGLFSRYLPRRRAVIALHVHGGWVAPLESTAKAIGVEASDQGILHPRKRFYAGGARSVRGFGENQLGPRVLTVDPNRLLTPTDSGGAGCTTATIADRTCDPNPVTSGKFIPRPLGGNTLIEGSVEYRFQLTNSLRAALFVDAGSVRGQRLNLPPGTRSAVTPGFGVRYNSPIGPVRIDLGIRPGIREVIPVVTQLMGADSTLHLIQLDTPKRYNPVEAPHGFLRSVTSRLQLHLAIGEAW